MDYGCLHFPATARNHEVIAEVLEPLLPQRGARVGDCQRQRRASLPLSAAVCSQPSVAALAGQ